MVLGSIIALAGRLHAYHHLSRQSDHVLADLGVGRTGLWQSLAGRRVPNARPDGPNRGARGHRRPIRSVPTVRAPACC